jgi:hypothetical protein
MRNDEAAIIAMSKSNPEVSSSTTKTQIYWLTMKQLLFTMNELLYKMILLCDITVG